MTTGSVNRRRINRRNQAASLPQYNLEMADDTGFEPVIPTHTPDLQFY
jgi:hypothetical protein